MPSFVSLAEGVSFQKLIIYGLFNNPLKLRLSLNDRITVNWKGCGRKLLWHSWRCHPSMTKENYIKSQGERCL
jgi:hypothetical protein